MWLKLWTNYSFNHPDVLAYVTCIVNNWLQLCTWSDNFFLISVTISCWFIIMVSLLAGLYMCRILTFVAVLVLPVCCLVVEGANPDCKVEQPPLAAPSCFVENCSAMRGGTTGTFICLTDLSTNLIWSETNAVAKSANRTLGALNGTKI